MNNLSNGDDFSKWSRYLVRELEIINKRLDYLESCQRKIEGRLIKLERLSWLVVGLFALVGPVIVWGLIQFFSTVFGV